MSHRTDLPRAAVALLAAALVVSACTGNAGQPPWTALPDRPETPVPSVAASGSAEPGASGPASPAASGAESPGSSPGGETAQVTIGTDTAAALQFDPASVTAPAGGTIEVTFENRSATVPHNLTFAEPINQATSPAVDPGASETLQLTAPAPGDYTYVCTLHPGMEGTLTVEGQ